MSLTPHHAKYFAHDLTRRASRGLDRLSMSLFDAAVDLNPHQIEAALFALQSPLSKGVILADEVGLGKTIEAGIVLCQFWAERKRRLLVICPASIRKQWAMEMEEKFNLPAVVVDAKGYRDARREGRDPLQPGAVLILSFHYANSLREELKSIAWDLVVIDEAHKLRNAYRPSNKVGQGIRDFLEDEGLPTNDDRVEFLLPVIKNLGTQRLKTVRLKKTINGVSTEFGDAFRKLAPVPTVAPPDPDGDPSTAYLQKNQVILNWYPKIQAMKSSGLRGGDSDAAPHQAHLSAQHAAFLDVDSLYFELERFKAERNWYNLNLTRSAIVELLAVSSWYRLLIPAEELAFDSFDRVRLWQEIALALLKKYAERYYTFRKREWELPHLEYRDLEGDDPNFLCVKESPDEAYYRILIDRSQDEIIAKLEELKAAIGKGDFKPWAFQGMKAIWFGKHLYEPLLYLDSKVVEISPAPLNRGERQFVEDLKAYLDSHTETFKDRELYLLRNLSKGKGVGFFEAGNFHPDFILWMLADGKQDVMFVDPKGIRNLGPTDPKIQFYETIKEIEVRLGDPDVRLQSYIVSNTPSATMKLLWNMEKSEMEKRHVLFQEDKDSYVGVMLNS